MKVISVELLKEFMIKKEVPLSHTLCRFDIDDFIDANSVEIPEQKEIIKIIEICQEVINCSDCRHNMTQHFAVSLHKIVKICSEQLTNKGEIK